MFISSALPRPLTGLTLCAQVDTHFPDRKSRRVLHGSCQLFAIAFVILGFLTALSTHSVTGRSNLGGGPVTQAYSVHTWLGYVSMVFLLGQMAAGLKKFVVKTRDDKNSASWHGVLGPLVYVFAMATSIAGFNALLPDRTLWRIVVSVRGRSLSKYSYVQCLIALSSSPCVHRSR